MRVLAALLASLVIAGTAFAGCVPQWVAPRNAAWAYGGDFEAGDFNGDGITDLASVTNNRVTVLPVTATGSGPANIVFTGDYLINRVLVRDVQGDGKLDLLASDVANNSIIVLPGNGDGTFGTPIVTAVGFSPTRIITGDFDGDGKLDVAYASYSGQLLGILQGDGAGAFAEKTAIPLPPGTNVEALAAGDFDGDGVDDLVLTYFDATFGDFFFGYADGSFNFDQYSETVFGADIAIADLDEDGDDDLVTADWNGDTMTLFRSIAYRSFEAVSYDAHYASSNNPLSIVIAEVTNDEILDVVMVMPNSRTIATFEGLGNATFGEATFAYTLFPSQSGSYFPIAVAAGNFNGDARTEIVIGDASRTRIGIYDRNNCGELTVESRLANKVISVGQETELVVTLRTPGDWYAEGYGPATGTVKVFQGTTEIASQTIPNGQSGVRVMLSGLGEGLHELHAEYEGDAHYDPAVSAPVTLEVTTVVTNVTIAASSPGPYIYGQSLQIRGDATASNGGSPTGRFHMTINGVEAQFPDDGPPVSFSAAITGAGTYRYKIHYEGNEAFPPGVSSELAIEVGKSSVQFFSAHGENFISTPGTTRIYYELDPKFFGTYATGTVTLREGDIILGAATLTNGGYVDFHPTLGVGRHALRLVYSGDANFFPASLDLTHDVVASSFWLDATSTKDNRIQLQWPYRNDASGYSVKQRAGAGWVEIAHVWSPYYEQTNVQPGVAYVYRVDALDAYQGILATSNSALGMVLSFTDDPIGTSTTVKALHLRELIAAANALRATAGLQPYAQTVNAGAPIRALDVTTLRTIIDQAVATLALPSFAWSAAPASGSPIRALHLRELRAAFR
jgi:hypothetical protein